MACFQFKLVAPSDRKQDGLSLSGEPMPDPLVGSEFVAGLNKNTFRPYLQKWDIAMVMFYEGSDRLSIWAGKHLKKASGMTQRPNHTFAAINCSQNEDFCVEQGVANLPYFKMYSRGEDVGFSNNPRKLTFEDMKIWLEKFPVVLPCDQTIVT